MHACRHPSIILTLAILIAAIGCRSSKPAGGLVQVTADQSGDLPEVEPVPQRLASAHTATESTTRSAIGPRHSGNTDSRAQNMVRQAQTSQAKEAAMAQTAAKPATTRRSELRSRSETVGTLAAKPTASKPTRQPATKTANDREAARSAAVEALMAANRGQNPQSDPSASAKPKQRVDLASKASNPRQARNEPVVDAKLTSDNGVQGEVVDAFAASPPEVQEQAIRRFVAAVAKKADKTVQPNSLDSALTRSLQNLPDLPAAKQRQSKVPPQRLAMSSPQTSPTGQSDPQVASASIGDELDVVHVADLSAKSQVATTDSTAAPNPDQLAEHAEEAQQTPVAEPDQSEANEAPETKVAAAVSANENAGTTQVADATPEVSMPTVTSPDASKTTVAEAKPSEPVTKPLLQPLTLPEGLETSVVQTALSAAAPDQQVRSVSATSDEDGTVARASGPPNSDENTDLEIPLPPLSLATPAPHEALAAIDSITMPAESNEQSDSAAPGPPTPVSPEFLSDQELYDALLTRLTTPGIGETDTERSRRLIMARHLMVLAGNPEKAAQKMEGLSQQEQKYLHHQLAGLWKMIDPKGHPVAGRRFSSALPELREATKYLAAATDSLEVKSLSFCTEIEAYGQVKTFPGNRFQAGQPVILYCEVDNFSVSKVEQGFETHLQGSYDVYNAANEKVVSQTLPADRQVASKYLRDYFIAYQMHLPKQLPAGTYRLQLTMEDVAGKKYGQASIPFEIAE